MANNELSAYLPDALSLREPDMRLGFDKYNDPYLVFDRTSAKSLAFDPSHPGKGVMWHFMNKKNPRETEQTMALLFRQGFLTPRRFACFSTTPFDWVSQDTSLVIARTYTRLSREYNISDPSTPWRESMIGVPFYDAFLISPQAVIYNLRIRGHRDLGWDIWSYVPPDQMLGIVRFSNEKCADQFQKKCVRIRDSFIKGEIDELAVAEEIWRLSKDFPIDNAKGPLSANEHETIWLSYAGAMTEQAMIEIAHEHMKFCLPETRNKLVRLKPSYPQTQEIREKAITE